MRTPVDIVYLSASILPSTRANSVHVMKMCNAFKDNSKSVVLFARHSSEHIEGTLHQYYGCPNTFPIEFEEWKPSKLGGFVYGWKSAAKLSTKYQAQVVYGRDLYSVFFAALKRSAKTIIYEAHAPPSSRIRISMERLLLERGLIQRLVVISDALKQWYIQNFKIHPKVDICVAHDGADESTVTHPVRSVPNTVGYVGSLYRGKGMEIISELSHKLPDTSFHIVGGSPQEIEHWKEKCGRNVTFFGYVAHGELDRHFAHFDVVIAPYNGKVSGAGGDSNIKDWMSPLKLFEYMAQGLPIVTTRLPVICEVFRHQENAMLVDEQDLEGWAHAIHTLMQNQTLRERIGQAARTEFIEKYTWKARANEVVHK